MEDEKVIARINELASEEHQLWNKESEGEITYEEREKLRSLEVTLDQCWDLLHQRRALRSAGKDPREAKVRAPEIVENYET